MFVYGALYLTVLYIVYRTISALVELVLKIFFIFCALAFFIPAVRENIFDRYSATIMKRIFDCSAELFLKCVKYRFEAKNFV